MAGEKRLTWAYYEISGVHNKWSVDARLTHIHFPFPFPFFLLSAYTDKVSIFSFL